MSPDSDDALKEIVDQMEPCQLARFGAQPTSPDFVKLAERPDWLALRAPDCIHHDRP